MATRGTFVSVKLNLSPELKQFLNSGWTPEDGTEVMQIIEDRLSLSNFPDVWRYYQGIWAPLQRDYERWKNLNYPGKQKWELTGAALHALSTPVLLSTSGGTIGAKSVSLSHSQRGVVRAEYKFKAPAAGGYFQRVNRIRTIWELMFKHRVEIENKIHIYLAKKLRDAGWK